MPRTCTICNHPKREPIERSLLSGNPLRTIAERWSVSKTSLLRHKTDHLSASLVKSQEAKEVLRADNLLDQVRALQTRTENLFGEAENILTLALKSKDLRTALAAIRELSGVNREARGT